MLNLWVLLAAAVGYVAFNLLSSRKSYPPGLFILIIQYPAAYIYRY